MNWNLSILIILAFTIVIFLVTQNRFKNKILCTFHRPNNTKIERWVPMTARAVIFDNGKYGIGQYEIDSECIELHWYERGFNKIFPTLVPTLEFNWDTPNPLNFKKGGQSSWHTPEVRYYAWQEHSHNAYAKSTASVSGIKQNKLFTVVIPLIIIGILVIGIFFLYTNIQTINGNLQFLQQQIKIK